MLTRRRFFGVVAASVALPSVSARSQPSNEWGSPAFDLHCPWISSSSRPAT